MAIRSILLLILVLGILRLRYNFRSNRNYTWFLAFTATGSFLTHTSNSTCNTHFAVNTQLITVGANGMYAGGGVLGDALASFKR